jgi:4-amino-4-deoxy-L-arabinose transferase-like glycosyltransferase
MEMPSLRTKVKLLLILLCWGVFALGFFGRFPLPGFFARLYLIALAIVVAISAYGFGSRLVTQAAGADLSPSEIFLFSSVAGFGIMALLMTGMGVVSLWTRGGAVAMIGIGLALAKAERKTLSILFGNGLSRLDNLKKPPFLIISLSAIVSLALAFAPVTYYDSLVYHFALPQTYVHAGRWVGRPELIYSAFPQVMEMLWTLGMLLANDVLANLIGWLVSVLGVFAVYSFAKRYFSTGTAAWAAALLSAMPAYLLLSSGGYVDVGLAVFSFASFYALSLWKDSPNPALLVLSGVLAGSAMGTKYTGAIPLVIGALFILKEVHPRTLKNIIIKKLLYVIPALLVFSPWLLKNFHYVGNPVFPFFYSWTMKPISPWVNAAAAGYFLRGLAEYAPRPWWHLFKLLWDVAVHGIDFGGGMDVLGDLGWAPFFAFLPAVWLGTRKLPAALSSVLLYAVLFFIPWGMSRPVLRFLVPLAPFLAVAAAYGYEQGVVPQTKGFQAIRQIVLGILLLSNVMLFFEVTDVLSSYKVPLGLQSPTDYLSQKLDYYTAASFVNTLPPDSLTYVVGDQRSYYYMTTVLVTPVFNTNPLTEWANQAASAEALASQLKVKGVTHLLINHSEFKRLNDVYHLFPFTAKGQANWDTLLSHLAKPLYSDKHCEVLALSMTGGS